MFTPCLFWDRIWIRLRIRGRLVEEFFEKNKLQYHEINTDIVAHCRETYEEYESLKYIHENMTFPTMPIYTSCVGENIKTIQTNVKKNGKPYESKKHITNQWKSVK